MEVKWRHALAYVVLCGLTACGAKDEEKDIVGKATEECATAAIPGEKIVRWKNGAITKHTFSENAVMMAASFAQANYKEIDFIEDNYRIHLHRPESVTAVGWTGAANWGVQYIKASELWDQSITGAGVIVAVIDSGIDPEHEQLRDQLYTNPVEVVNRLDDDGNGLVDDVHGYDFTSNSGFLDDTTGHGTHVAGIIAANHEGEILGVAPGAKLLVYDFFTASGEGTVYDAIRAIAFAAEAGAKVINASWGGPGCSKSLNRAIDDLNAKDVLFVSAAGNESQNIDLLPSYPASHESATHISVAAMTADEYTAGFSNYGNIVHIAAPGVNILSTYPGNDTAIQHGTSMAAPFVSGAAALLFSAFPQATAMEIKEALMSSVTPGHYPVASRGALNVAGAYQKLKTKYGNASQR